MKFLKRAFLAALLALTALPASAEIIGVEQFDYPDGTVATRRGGTFWDYKNFPTTGHTGTASTWDNVTAAPTVAAGRLVTQSSAAKREYNGAVEADGAVNDPASVPSSVAKSVYYRVSVTTGASVPTAFGLSSYDFGTEKIFFGKRSSGVNFVVEETGVGGTGTSTNVAPNTTYLLVARLDYVANTIRIFVNPDLNAAEPVANAEQTYNGTNWSTAVRLSSTGGDPVTWDDLVVATTWADLGTVVTTTVDEDNGSLGGGAGVSLREAVKYSPSGFITFAPGLSGQTITLSHADGDMLIPNAVTIDATALSGGLTLDGNNTSRHFDVQTGKFLTVRGLTLKRGNGTGGTRGDGGSIVNGGTLTLHRCTLTGNAATFQGGAISSFGTLRATDCNFSDNTAGRSGGGVMLFEGTVELSRCTLSGNTGSGGGAIFHQSGGTVILSHCTIAGNRATAGTGGLEALEGVLTLHHCTVSQNTGDGGGLYLEAPATVNVQFSIIAGNADPGGSHPDIAYSNGTLNAAGNSLIGDNTSVATQFPAGPLVGTAAAPLDPKLSPLGYFGGPVQTMHPLVGSPAIEGAGIVDIGGTDARGFPRFVDGDANGTAARDIGAVEAGLITTVNVNSDFGLPGSLRTAINIAVTPGARIGFSSSTFPGTITLAAEELAIPATSGLFIDASNLSGPVTLSGNNASRVFNIPAAATVAMHSLRIVDGKAADGLNAPVSSGAGGGGIISAGSLSLFSCTIANNRSGRGGSDSFGPSGSGGDGGGIRSTGPLSLTACTVSGNTTGHGGNSGGAFTGNGSDAGHGGGIYSNGPLSLTACTLSGNVTGNGGNGSGTNGIGNPAAGGSGGGGGAIRKDGTSFYRLTACTIVGNRTGSGGTGPGASGAAGGGGGLSSGPATLQNCLIAQNLRGPSTPNDVDVASVTYAGANLLGTTASASSTTGPAPIINANPLLAPLGDYGGPTQTMALRTGSPARNAAGARNEVQQINLGAFPVSFTLTFKGATTTTLNQSSTANQVQTALEALATIGAGNVTVTRSVDGGGNVRYEVTFTGAFAASDQPLIADNGSPVVTTLQDGSPAAARRTDQRGFPIVGLPDLGAYEAGTITNYANFIWETLPATATLAQHAATFDFDGDGANNGDEYLAGTVVTNPLSVLRILSFTRTGDLVDIAFPTVAGRNYTFEYTDTLSATTLWTPVPGSIPGNGSVLAFDLGPFPGFTKLFVRVRVGP